MVFKNEMPLPVEIGVVPFGRVPKELSYSGFLLEGMPLQRVQSKSQVGQLD